MAIGDKKSAVMQSDIGIPGGVASLDTAGNVPAAQRKIADDADETIQYKLGVENGALYIQQIEE